MAVAIPYTLPRVQYKIHKNVYIYMYKYIFPISILFPNMDLIQNTERYYEFYSSLLAMCMLVSSNTCIYIYTGVEQNNGNTIDTVHISLLIWCWTTFFLQYSTIGPPFAFNTTTILLGMNSYKFWTAPMRILYILLEEHLQVALEMLEEGVCFSL
jgi:hypothetical protein